MKTEAALGLYFQPGENHFVGDCMPFWHDGVYHLLYLLDEGHHQGGGGLGGHQWGHLTTTDLIHWTHHPLALAIEHDWEGSICTGSVYVRDKIFHAFFATRMRDYTQHLGRAESADGIHFTKCDPNPFFSVPEGYDPQDCRDPFVFRGEVDGRFHLLATARQTIPRQHERGGGCLLHLTSSDLIAWKTEEKPFFAPGDGSVPECPDYFFWNGWYYLLFGLGLQTRYRMSRQPFGPWEKPRVDVLGSPKLAVMKTAPFGPERRIGAAWIGSRREDRDAGAMLWGGNLVLRELIQNDDGTLGTRFVPEQSLPAAGKAGKTISPIFRALTDGAEAAGESVHLRAGETPEVAVVEKMPLDFRLRIWVRPGNECGRLGLRLRGTENFKTGYELGFDPGLEKVWLQDEIIEGVDGLQAPFDLEVICSGDIVDVCVGGRRCLINRLPEARGRSLFLFAQHGDAAFDIISLETLDPAR